MSYLIGTSFSYCQVAGCRFPNTHLTKSHKCGKCSRFGHGQVECGHPLKVSILVQRSRGIRFPAHLRCEAPACRQAYSHTSESHICSKCNERHFETFCTRNTSSQSFVDQTSESYAISEGKKVLGNTSGYVFDEFYAGMGCQWFVKRNSTHSPISAFFMHSDNWGQYGLQTDDRPKLIAFLSGYRNAKTGKFFFL